MNALTHADTRSIRPWLLLFALAAAACDQEGQIWEECDCEDADGGRSRGDARLDAQVAIDAARSLTPGSDAAPEARTDASGPLGDASFDASTDASTDATTDAAATELACVHHDDCALYETECCPCYPPNSRAGVRVGLRSSPPNAPACSQAQCGVCEQPAPGPLDAKLRAACVAGQCAVVDVRQAEISRCGSDAECRIENSSACDPCTNRSEAWFGVRRGADLSLLIDPRASMGACPLCVNPEPLPTAFCAPDGHCAVRATVP